NANDNILGQSYLGGINTSNTGQQQQNVQDSVSKFWDQNCDSYVQQWAQQLSPCQYGQNLQDTILPRLRALCRLACDADHPFGASSLPAGQSYTPAGTNYHFTSFEDIIDTYNQLHGVTTGASCNAELITAPSPYNSQPIYSVKPTYGKPSECECSLIRTFYLQYKATGRRDGSFSAWLQRTQGTTMTESDLSQLLAACGNSNTGTEACTWFSHPIYLPPAFQCNSGSVCASCTLVDSVYHDYIARYPSDTPRIASDPDDSVQLAKNKLFQNYMNNRLGYSKETWEYLQFLDTCAAHTGEISNSTECLPGDLGNIFTNMGADQLSDIHAIPGNGYIIAGNASGVGAGGKDAYAVKAAQDGTVQWAKTWGGGAEDRFIRIKPTSDNGYIAIGTTKSATYNRGEMLLVKMTSSGTTEWIKSIGYGTPNGEYGYDVIQTSDGGYAALGVYNQHGGTGDLLLARLNSTGTLSWVRRFGAGAGDNNASCTIDDVDTINYSGSPAYGLLENQDTLLISGTAFDANMGARYFGVIYKVDEDAGDLLSSWHYADQDSNLSTWFGDLHATASGYMLSVTNAPHFGSAGAQTAVVRLSSSGTVTGFRRFNLPAGSSGIASAAMYPAADGGYLVGQTGNNTPHIFWQRVDANGSLLWSSETTMPGTQTLGRITRNADSSFAAVGTTGNHALVLHLLATAATGCYDSSVNLGLSSPPLAKINWAIEATQPLALSSTDAGLAENNIEISDSSLACPGNNQCYNNYTGPTLCGKASPLLPPVAVDSITACSDSTFFAVSKATELQKVYTDSLTGDFEQRYLSTCMQAYKHESFTVTYVKNEYHYTLYYYDQSGNLVRTVPPAGAHPNHDAVWLAQVRSARDAGTSLTPAHTLATEYRYNTLSQVVTQNTPDGGTGRFWYDRLGRLCISQNAKQQVSSQYSYTQYDTIGRIVQVGQLTSATMPTDSISRNETVLAQWIAASASTAEQITKTVYDYGFTPIEPELSARNIRNRVAWTALYNTAADMNNVIPMHAAATYYSYDILGNVDTVVQDYGRSDYAPVSNVMNAHGNRFKKLAYDYDLVSGKVNKVLYQSGESDAFYHSYIYDAENRITNVQTSKDSINWDNDAFYTYFSHGPLARTILGEQQVQGINYSYTIHGWVKSVNPSIVIGNGYTLKPDGTAGSVVAANAYSYLLNYFKGDYNPVSGATPSDTLIDNTLASEYRPLFNGNISSMGVNISALTHPLLYNYQYDQLNRIVSMDAWNRSGGAWFNIAKLPDFAERVSYDPNGNILSYMRNGNNTFSGSPIAMDKLRYSYISGTNRLDYITDSVPSGNYTVDIDSQDAGNYRYDPTGNLIFDSAAG
ncbi:MAG: hypothetical protein JST39_25535, partial [Bacteroidetes bacterium]|nr:hypothetical protein [Bacteroidota bacterium]